MIDKGWCNNGFIWNPNVFEFECDKSCDVEEYLYCVNCKCRNKLIDKQVEKCDEDTGGNEMIYNVFLHDHGRVCKSCTLYLTLLNMSFIIIMFIGSACF